MLTNKPNLLLLTTMVAALDMGRSCGGERIPHVYSVNHNPARKRKRKMQKKARKLNRGK